MTTIEAPATEYSTTAESYRAAIIASSNADRAYASVLATDVIEVVKAFSSVKGRLNGQGHPDSLDFALLIRLAKEGPMRGGDLAEQLCFDPSTVSRQVAGLVKAGLVERRADPKDGRASILVPTESGLAQIAEWVQMRGRLFAPIFADWSGEDRDAFARLLHQFVAGLSANLEAVKTIAADFVKNPTLDVDPQGRNA